MKLGRTGQKWLKTIHVTLAGSWIGAGVSLLVVQLASDPQFDAQLYGIDRSMKLIDDFVIIPLAMGTALTALVYSTLTHWGFFRHRWVTIKWVIVLANIAVGIVWLGPLVNSLPPISAEQGLAALNNDEYTTNRLLNAITAPVQLALLLFAMVLSTLKPWGRREHRRATRS